MNTGYEAAKKALDKKVAKTFEFSIDEKRVAMDEVRKQLEERRKKLIEQALGPGAMDMSLEEKSQDLLTSVAEVKGLKDEVDQMEKAAKDAQAAAAPPPEQGKFAFRPLIYLMHSRKTPPPWIIPLAEALQRMGYLLFNPMLPVEQQYNPEDLPQLHVQPLRVVESLCGVLKIPPEVLLPINHPKVVDLLRRGSDQDADGETFQSFWFIVRSSLVLCDLESPDVSYELTYAHQLGIPSIGIMPPRGGLTAWAQRSLSVVHTGRLDLTSLAPLLRGYAPLISA